MEKNDTPLERAVERLTALATDLDYAAMPTKPDVVTLCGGYAAEARDDLRLILSANREMREALFMCATHCQGGHSEAGYAAAQILGVPFPITMPDLVAKVRAEGLDPDKLWPWYAEMRVARSALTQRGDGE